MSMGLIFNLALFFLGTNIIRDRAQCHRKQHWSWSQKTQVVIMALLLSNCENLMQLRPQFPYLEFRNDNAVRSEEIRKT